MLKAHFLNFLASIILGSCLLVYVPTHQAPTQGSIGKGEAHTQPKNVAKRITISGVVTQTSSYCGGIPPSKQLLKRLATPKPYPAKTFHVIKGDVNTVSREIVLSFTSDQQGAFSFQLSPGTYSIIVDEQAKPLNADDYKKGSISVDEACLKSWWAKPYQLLEVKDADIKGLKFEFHHRCFIRYDIPCLRYTGPLPG
jgi:hypothetical protein